MIQLADEGPTYFYKYKRIDEEHLDYSSRIFTHNELYFSTANEFNDPFDCRFRYKLNGSEADRVKFLKRIQKEKYPYRSRRERRSEIVQLRREIKSPGYEESFQQDLREGVISKWGIYCLSAVPDDILMWAHYADGHRGFCLEFLNDPNDQFHAKRQPNDPDFRSHPCLFPYEVEYSEEYPVINPLSEDYADDEKIGRKAFLTKATQWQYEKEWRILGDNNTPGPHQFPSRFLTGIIFGCKMSDAHKDMIHEWCKGRQQVVKYYEAQRAADAYALKIIPA